MTTPGNQTAGLGWNPDPPSFLDYKFGAAFAPVSMPAAHSLRNNCSPVRNQGNIGSCTGFSTAAAIEYLRRCDSDEFSTIYSPLFLYYEAREREGTIDVDCGAYIRTLMDVARKEGAAPESAWKYDEKRFAKLPNPTAYEKAKRWKLGAHYRCETMGQVLQAIAKGFPVVGGFMCHTGMEAPEVNRTGVIPLPRAKRDRPTGGHAVCFIGYDHATRTVEFKNSWGTDWGDAGYGKLPFEYVERRDLSGDFWAVTAEAPPEKKVAA